MRFSKPHSNVKDFYDANVADPIVLQIFTAQGDIGGKSAANPHVKQRQC